jgi:hypothetical protein
MKDLIDGNDEEIDKLDDPYCKIALKVFAQVFRDIYCYFNQTGTAEEIKEGYKSLKWIRKMEGNFQLLAGAAPISLPEFHQKCLKKIINIKNNARYRLSKAS